MSENNDTRIIDALTIPDHTSSTLSRRDALARAATGVAAIAGAAALTPSIQALAAAPAIHTAKPTLVIGAKGFSENEIVAYMYMLLLRQAGVSVSSTLKDGLASGVATTALQRGGQNNGIDIFPEYTGTAVNVVLQQTNIPHKPEAYFKAAVAGYQSKYKLTFLNYSPMNDAQGFATSQAISKQYGIKSIADMVKHASQLRLIAAAEYLDRADGPKLLAKIYGSFKFKSEVILADVGSQRYAALQEGRGDVTEAFTTDGLIAADNLVVLTDPKGYALPDNLGPVVNDAALTAYPVIKTVLNNLAPHVTSKAITKLNYQADGQGKKPLDVARAFLTSNGLLK